MPTLIPVWFLLQPNGHNARMDYCTNVEAICSLLHSPKVVLFAAHARAMPPLRFRVVRGVTLAVSFADPSPACGVVQGALAERSGRYILRDFWHFVNFGATAGLPGPGRLP